LKLHYAETNHQKQEDRTLSVSASVSNPERTVTVRERVFSCEYDGCTKVFKTNNDRRKHMRNIHNMKPYQCEQCEMKFMFQKELKYHQEVNCVSIQLKQKTANADFT